MQLSGSQCKQLSLALIDAFPNTISLARMLLYELDKNLIAVAGEGSLQDIVFGLIRAANSQGWVEDLVRAARNDNPRNPKLNAIAQELLDTKSEKQQQEAEILRQKQDKLDDGLSSARNTVETWKSQEEERIRYIETQQFEFEYATIINSGFSGKGKIYEIKRYQNQAQFFTQYLDDNVTLEMVLIPAGYFKMGSPPSENNRKSNEEPQYTVKMPTFFMSKFAITQEQYQQVMGSNPSRFNGMKRPVESVSWNDAMEFCKGLSQKTGRTYRLPSEAEWEYACRADTTMPFHFGETITADLANYNSDSTYASGPKGENRKQTTEVGSFPPNAFGLYDMHGNVWEWCEDTWHDNYIGAPTDGSPWINDNNDKRYLYLLRGGSWYDSPDVCRSANRHQDSAGHINDRYGFRVLYHATQ
jgi:formylglycine-generating enzyme required for sulfatase activity